MLYYFQVVADYWSNFWCPHGIPLFNSVVWGERINLELHISRQ